VKKWKKFHVLTHTVRKIIIWTIILHYSIMLNTANNLVLGTEDFKVFQLKPASCKSKTITQQNCIINWHKMTFSVSCILITVDDFWQLATVNSCEWVSEWILNGTSAQLGYVYTVAFTLVHAGKYRTEDRLSKIQTTWKQYTIQTKSQAVARIADRTAKNCRGHVT